MDARIRNSDDSRLTRRTFLAGLTALSGGALVADGAHAQERKAGAGSAPGAAPAAVSDEALRALAGKRVPEITYTYRSRHIALTQFARKHATDLKKLGLAVKLDGLEQNAWTNRIFNHTFGDIVDRTKTMLPHRIAAPEVTLLYEMLHSSQAVPPRWNFGEYVNPAFDRLVEAARDEFDEKKRRALVHRASEIHAADHHLCLLATGPTLIQAYNKEEWDGAVNARGYCIASEVVYWTPITARSRSGRRRLVVGTTKDIEIIPNPNVFGPGNWYFSSGMYVYDRFAILDRETLAPRPWAAAEWRNVSPTTWEIQLRAGMKWHDGHPVTVDDAVFTFKFIKERNPGYYSMVGDHIAAVEVVNREKGVFRVTTRKPLPSFVGLILPYTPIVPKHQWERIMEDQGADRPEKVVMKQPIGSGPFKFEYAKRGVEMLLSANKAHWSAPRHIDEYLVVLVPSRDSLLGKLQSKEIDFANDPLTPSQAAELKRHPHIGIERAASLNYDYLEPFTAHMPWRDAALREAWHWAVDRDYFINVCYEGAAERMTDQVFSTPMPYYHPKLADHGFDVNRARAILQKAGYTFDGEARLVYPAFENEAWKRRVREMVIQPKA
jgi:peptide/nickel transport system substrate-binding protein